MNFVNLTPHEINIVLEKDQSQAIPPSGEVARVASVDTPQGEFNGVPLFSQDFGLVEGLPDPQDGTMYLVSALVRSALPLRKDLGSPGGLVRDPEGRIIGCKGLVINP